MHIAEVVTIAKSLPLLRLNTYKSLILSYSADYRRIFKKKANFFKQFGYLTTYAILLSIVCIILSILNQCSTTEMLPIVELVKCEWSFTPQDILATSRIIFYGLIKASLVYFVLDLLYIVLFTVCSFIDYLNGEIKDIEESSEQ